MNKKIDEPMLYRTAARVFSRNGFGKTKMGHVADDLGLASGTIYRYVRDKKDLYRKTIAFGYSRWQDRVRTAIAEFDDPLEKLIVLSFAGFSFLRGEPDFLKILVEYPSVLDNWSSDESVADINRGSVEILRDVFSGGIAAGVFKSFDPDILAQAFFDTYMLFVRRIYIEDKGDKTWNMVTTGLEVLVLGIVNRSIPEDRPHELISRHFKLIPS